MSLIIGLSVVIVAFDGEKPRVLATRRDPWAIWRQPRLQLGQRQQAY